MNPSIGLDMSLQATGVCLWMPDAHPVVTTIKTKPAAYGPSIAARAHRAHDISVGIFMFLMDNGWQAGKDTEVAIEQPAYASSNGSQHERAGLWWKVTEEFVDMSASISEVPPTTLKKFVTSRGNVDKDEVVFRAAREFPGFETLTNNEADALWLACMARGHQDQESPGFSMTAGRKLALKSVAWAR